MNNVVAEIIVLVVTLMAILVPLLLMAGCFSIALPIPGTQAPAILPPPAAQPAVNSPRAIPPLQYDPGESTSWRDLRRAGTWLRGQDWGGEWTSDEVGAAGLFVALSGADAGLSASKIGSRSSCYEGDPIITAAAGTRRPSSADFALAAVVGVGLGVGVAAILPPMWRDYFLTALIAVEGYNVATWATNNCPWGATARPAAPAATGPAYTDGPAGWAAGKPGISAY